MTTFVSGAASPLGRAVVAALRQRGEQVRGQVRRLGGIVLMRRLGAEPVVGDIRTPHGLLKALDGCDTIFHLASFFDFWAPRPDAFESVNVGGTKNIMAAALLAGVRRVIICSSAVTVGADPGEVGDEFTTHRGRTVTEFERSKLAAERLALRLRPRGIEVVVVNPGIVLAHADPGWTGRLIARCVSDQRPLAGDAPLGWVWVGDAAKGILRAGDQGKDGERYILCGAVMSSRELLQRVASHVDARPPRTLPRPIAIGEAALATAIARPFHRRPMLPLDEARFLTTGFKVDGSLATEQLGVEYTPLSHYLPDIAQTYRSAMGRLR